MDRGKKPRTTAATEERMWSSLLSDAVREIGRRLLATGDVDYYVNMRDVPGWRADLVDPKKHPEDPRFDLRQWVMLDEEHPKGGLLFLNTITGRIRHIELPGLTEYYFVISTGGHLVVATRKAPHTVHVVNPLADSCIKFTAPIPDFLVHATAHLRLAAGNTPTLVLEDPSGDRAAYSAALKDEHFTKVKYSPLDKAHNIWGIRDGIVDGLLSEKIEERSWERYPSCYFVQSAGEMLLVLGRKDPARGMEVFKVNFQQKVIEPLRDIGSRALFLGDRCVSVDAAKIHSIDSNCVYYRGRDHHDGPDGIYMYDLTTEREELITSDLMQFIGFYGKPVTSSMIQLLVNYCTNIPLSQLARE